MRRRYKSPKFLPTHPLKPAIPITQEGQAEGLFFPKNMMGVGMTTYEEDYVKHSFSPQAKTTPVPQSNISAKPREGWKTTTYREMSRTLIQAIRRHEVGRTPPSKPCERRPDTSTVAYSSEYRDVFTKKPLVLEPCVKPVAIVNNIPFRGTSTMKSDYKFIKLFPH
ncbi:uncharacterized protein Tco025E_09660, partial [Trypanosoma conorhini]